MLTCKSALSGGLLDGRISVEQKEQIRREMQSGISHRSIGFPLAERHRAEFLNAQSDALNTRSVQMKALLEKHPYATQSPPPIVIPEPNNCEEMAERTAEIIRKIDEFANYRAEQVQRIVDALNRICRPD
ncbi:hypothetical protein [Leptolyngbya sp. AN10]|uniref:hypothetical protein n=1 Tax=Leptolyngbya sp. AN10 TaxID=3423365 RepID=UPI003D31D28A